MSEIEAHRGTLAVCCRPTFIKWSVIAVLVFVVALVFASCGLAMIRNSWHLHQIQRALATIAPPPQSERLATRSGVGLLTENGNHGDFFAGAMFVSKSAPEAIRQHYAGRTFLNPSTSTQEQIDVTILTNQESLRSVWLPDRFEQIEAWDLSAYSFGAGTVFLVSVMRSYEANNDCRCH